MTIRGRIWAFLLGFGLIVGGLVWALSHGPDPLSVGVGVYSIVTGLCLIFGQ